MDMRPSEMRTDGRGAAPATVLSPEAMEIPFDEREFAFIADLVYQRSGIVLGAGKMKMVYARLARRIRELGLKSFAAYCALIEGRDGEDEIGHLINAITTNLTRFFREDHHFDHLGREAMAEFTAGARANGNRLRIWSAGCSSGEEPYSIAMTLLEACPELSSSWDARILATDLDTTMLKRGSDGVYRTDALAEIDAARLTKYFRHSGPAGSDDHVVSAPVRALVTFKQLNLQGPWPMKGPFDAIFCRNVMIYFDNPTKARLIARFGQMLRPGGYLYVGHSETILSQTVPFRLVGRTIYRKAAS